MTQVQPRATQRQPSATPRELGIRPDDPWASPALTPGLSEPTDRGPQEDGAPDGFKPVSVPISPPIAESAEPPAAPATVGPITTAADVVPRGSDSKAALTAPAGMSTTLRSALALAGVIGLIVLLAWGYRTCSDVVGRRIGKRASSRGLIEIIARQSLTPKLSVWLLRVGDRVTLVGSSADGLRALDVVSDPDACARLLGRSVAGKAGSATAEFKSTLADAARPYSDPAEGDESDEPTHITEIKARLADALHRLKAVKTGA